MGGHPLDPLSADEISAAIAIMRSAGLFADDSLVARVALHEPRKGDPSPAREADVTVVPGPSASLREAVVSLTDAAVVSVEEVAGARPALLLEEALNAIGALQAHEGYRVALAERGITDLKKVQVDPWPAGTFGITHEEGRRITRCLSYYRENPGDNGYGRPIEGLLAIVDMARGEVLELIDEGVVPLPPDPATYGAADRLLRGDVAAIEIVQPDGPGFTIDGNLLRWGRWSLRVGFDPYEGLVLHELGYEDGGRVRPVLHRAAVSEMVVPYGDPGTMHAWKNAFDAGEWGLGRLANSLVLGCDCLGEIRYLDATFSDEHGNPYTVPNVICLHEEDFGILWKHTDLRTGDAEVRRQRRMVISSISTVGNYDYGFYWYLYLDGTIELEVKLTGILSTRAFDPSATEPTHAAVVAEGLAAPHHQHLFCVRLDLDVDGTINEVHEVDVLSDPPGADNPLGGAFRPRTVRLESEKRAVRKIDPARSRTWRIVNPGVRNAHGQPVAYKLLPGPSPTLLADPSSSVSRRAGFATANLWVTPYSPDERRAAGDHPNQSSGGDGLPRWTAADRSLLGADIVVWHTFGVTHVPRPEDWPVMPVERCGFSLVPSGFFDRNPTLDVPPPDHHCHG